MKPKIDTVVQFSCLKSGRYEYEHALDNSFFKTYENEDLQEGNVNFHVILEKRERTLLFTFAFQGTVKTTCDRCLGELLIPVEGDATLCVKFSDTETSDDEDTVILSEDAYQIDLAQWMYEYVVVSLPIQKVHAEGECDPEMLKYIAEEHSERDDTEVRELSEGESDPRWAPLKDLLDK